MSARRTLALAAGLLVALAGCGGGGEKTGSTATGTQSTATGQTTTAAGPIELIRWPRFWATRDAAETGADDNLGTQYYVGLDDNAVVYNGQDVVRLLKPNTGKPVGRVLLPTGQYVCAVSPRREIDSGVAVFGVGELRGESTCGGVIGVSTKTGKVLWHYGRTGGPSTEALVDERDGKVLWSDRHSIAVIDARSGRELWKRSGRKLVHQPVETGGCQIAPALAADAPVVIVSPSSCEISEGEHVLGLDLASGRQLWRTLDPRDPEEYSSYSVYPHPLDGRFVGPIQAERHRAKPAMVAFFDAKTGDATAFASPAMKPSDGRQPQFEDCGDSGSTSGLTFNDWCVFIGGGHALYVDTFPGSKFDGIDIAATDAATGKLQWRYGVRAAKGGKDDAYFAILGFNADRTEFWVSDRRDRIQRINLADGKVVGRGKPGPPLDIPRFTIVAHKSLYIRGESGISDVRSGLDYYKTDAP